MDSYEAAWRRYRKWTVWSAVLQVGVVPVMLMFYAAWRGQFPAAWAVFALVAFIVAAVLVGDWPCPRCSKPFFGIIFWYQWVATRCHNCGLPKWAPGP